METLPGFENNTSREMQIDRSCDQFIATQVRY